MDVCVGARGGRVCGSAMRDERGDWCAGKRGRTGFNLYQIILGQSLARDRIRAILICACVSLILLPSFAVRDSTDSPMYLSINAFSYTFPDFAETTGTVGVVPETTLCDQRDVLRSSAWYSLAHRNMMDGKIGIHPSTRHPDAAK